MKTSKLVSLLLAGFALYSSAVFADTLKWQSPSFSHLHGMGSEVKYSVLKRKDNGKSYHIYVRMPENKDEKKTYPVVYLLDGGITFPLLSSHYYVLNAVAELPEVIVVGISYGTADWRKGNNRSVDFTAPSDEREHWGGADKFLTYMQSTMFPLIEKDLPVDPSKRILFGNSLGGQFGLYTARQAKQPFYGIIASNPAIHTNTEFYLAPVEHKKTNTVKLFIGSAENDAERFKAPFEVWLKHWQKQPSLPWDLNVKTIPDHGHVSSVPDAFRLGMKWLLTSTD